MNTTTAKIKEVGSCILGFVIMFAFLAIPILFIWGSVWLSTKVIPWLNLISGIMFGITIFLLLPLSIFSKTRAFAGSIMVFTSYVFGLNLWFLGLILTYTLWGFIGLFIGLFMAGIGVVPIAMLATLFNGMWQELGILFLLLVLTFGIRLLGLYLIEKVEVRRVRVEEEETKEVLELDEE